MTPGGRAFEAEGTAITKALRSECVWSMEDQQGASTAGAEGVRGGRAEGGEAVEGGEKYMGPSALQDIVRMLAFR